MYPRRTPAPVYAPDEYRELEEIGEGRYGRPDRWQQEHYARYPDEAYGGEPYERRAERPRSEWLSHREGYRNREDFSGRGPKGYRRSDERIREDVSDRFTIDPDLDPTDVTVHVENGDVILSGTVRTRAQKRHAEVLAERTAGVRDVINQIRVT